MHHWTENGKKASKETTESKDIGINTETRTELGLEGVIIGVQRGWETRIYPGHEVGTWEQMKTSRLGVVLLVKASVK